MTDAELLKDAYEETIRNYCFKQYVDSLSNDLSAEDKLKAISAFCAGWEAKGQFLESEDQIS